MVAESRVAIDTVPLPELLHWHPKRWWDPVPWWFAKDLDRAVLKKIAVSQMEIQREMLAIQIKATERALDILEAGK